MARSISLKPWAKPWAKPWVKAWNNFIQFTTGLLSALTPPTIASGTTPYGITISPEDNFDMLVQISAENAKKFKK